MPRRSGRLTLRLLNLAGARGSSLRHVSISRSVSERREFPLYRQSQAWIERNSALRGSDGVPFMASSSDRA